jgi:hypothetical protein
MAHVGLSRRAARLRGPGRELGSAAAELDRHLLFVADTIPRELQRIIEFLNESMATTEVLAIEVRQFLGEGHRVMVPRVIGNTAAAEERKQTVRSTGGRRRWTLDEFRRALAEHGGPDGLVVLDAGIAWAEQRGGSWELGYGKKYGPLYLTTRERRGEMVKLVALDTAGSLGILYSELQNHEPFNQVDARLDLNRRLNGVPGASIPEEMAIRARWPLLKNGPLAPSALPELFAALDYVADRLAQDVTDAGARQAPTL